MTRNITIQLSYFIVFHLVTPCHEATATVMGISNRSGLKRTLVSDIHNATKGVQNNRVRNR